MLTKKHFEKIAEIIRKNKEKQDFESVCNDLANYFAEENPLFNKSKFMEACKGK